MGTETGGKQGTPELSKLLSVLTNEVSALREEQAIRLGRYQRPHGMRLHCEFKRCNEREFWETALSSRPGRRVFRWLCALCALRAPNAEVKSRESLAIHPMLFIFGGGLTFFDGILR